MTYFLLSDDDFHSELFNLQSQTSSNPATFQYQYLNIDINLIREIEAQRNANNLKTNCFFADSLLKSIEAGIDSFDAQASYKIININQLEDRIFDLLLTDKKGVLINLDSFEKNSYLLTSLEVLDRADIDGFNRLDPSYQEGILKRISELLKIQLNIFAEENSVQDIFYVRNYQDEQAVKFLKYEYRSVFDKAIQENKSLISQIIQRQASPSSSNLEAHFNSLNDPLFNKFKSHLGLINLESPEENSYLISLLKDPKIFGDNNFDRLPQEARNEILKYINDLVKLHLDEYSEQLQKYSKNTGDNNIFYVRNYKDGKAVKFLRPECKDLIMDAVKQNQSSIASAFKNIIDSFYADKDMLSDRIIDKNVDDLSDQDFNNLLKSQEVILIDLDKPRNNQRLIALLRNKDIFGEQNLDKLSPALKIAFLNKVNEILKTSLELNAQELVGANPFYVRKYQDDPKAKFLKYEHFNLIDEIIYQNKELIATSIKSILQQSTLQLSPTQPRVLKTNPVSSSSPSQPTVLQPLASLRSLHTQPMVLETKPSLRSLHEQPMVLETKSVNALIDQFENRQNVQETSSTSSTASNPEKTSPRKSISPEIALLKEIFETNLSNSPSNVVVSPRLFPGRQSSTNQQSPRL